MADALSILGGVLCVLGALATIIGAIGVLRFPDFYTRIHAAGVTDTLGASLLLVGLMLMAPTWIVAVKLFIVWVLVMIASPTATHALANAANARIKPQIGNYKLVVSDPKDAPK